MNWSCAKLKLDQGAVIGAKIGEGYLVFHGDVNPGPESDAVILALCGIRAEIGRFKDW